MRLIEAIPILKTHKLLQCPPTDPSTATLISEHKPKATTP
jgi:hypothetical protein